VGVEHAAGGTLTALYNRDVTGEGQHVDVSAQQAATVATQAYLLAEAVGASTTSTLPVGRLSMKREGTVACHSP